MRELSKEILANPEPDTEFGRCGVIAVIGRANVGKSTLINRIAEEKVSIVSPVAQTTRNLVRAVITETRGQLVFLDTPGVHKARQELNHLMNRMARASLEGADAVLLILDCSQSPREEDEGWMRRLCRQSAGLIFVLNKIDGKNDHENDYRRIWSAVAAEKDSRHQPDWHRLSALKGEGVEALVEKLFDMMPESPFLFSRDMLSDYPRKLMIADLVREKFFQELYDEIPHSLAVEVRSLEEKDQHWMAAVDVYVKRPGQKGIVIGHKGRLLRKVKRQARGELEEIYQLPVRLDIRVKVDPKWDRNHFILKRLGYKE